MTLLLIHSGGTIGMGPGPEGLMPVPGKLEAAVAARLAPGGRLETHAFDPLLDSADVGPAHWNLFLDLIAAHPGADVILTHGTDTMAFTGAALSQALAGSGRRVVLCGSMQPLGMGGDGEANLDLALQAAREADPGVWLAFAGRLLPADGLVKTDSHAAGAFTAVPQPPAWPRANPRFGAARVAVLTLSPGLPVGALRAMLAELDGAVLRVFGAGTMMAEPALLQVLAEAVQRGTRIRAVSQCLQGGLEPGAYAAGAGLWATGVANGGLETAEAALIRLWLDLSA
ncbi:asparaginase domain-containing protein [Gemmobacter serpentinus]|uniref:asparaginase domain-containing protein n=1 Tax=Gemmobacter serpentinus TaxID=2652247 RepID=UPI00124F3FB1|nr:asparaginase domain-containing protein [Gemmobacter serpentinus]